MKDYKGYSARVAIDEEQNLIHGEVIGITDVITFQGRTPAELAQAFQDSVDDYLAFCEERGTEPDRPYSGRFVVRVSPAPSTNLCLGKQGRGEHERLDVSACALAVRSASRAPLSAAVCRKDVIRLDSVANIILHICVPLTSSGGT